MKNRYSKILGLLIALSLVMSLAGCGSVPSGPTIAGGNPAAPPTPPAEIPALRFPDSLSREFDISTVASAGTGELPALEIGDDISDEISDTASNFIIFAGLVDTVLSPLHDLVIPRSVEVTKFEDLLILGDSLVNVKIDFSPYDEDNDGRVEACSGNTGVLPICYRIWFDGKRALSGIFLHAFPTEENSGDGRFRGLSPVKLLGVIPFATSVSYDVRDPANKQAEYFLATPKNVEDGEAFPEPPKSLSEIATGVHLLFTQTGPNETATKTILGTIRTESEEEKHLGRWKEGDDFWSGSRDLDDNSRDFTAACANIPTGLVVDSLECVERDIDTAGVDFLDFLEISDLAFPNDFPTTPEF